MTAELRKATLQDALTVASNLRPEDLQELEGVGFTPFQVVWGVLLCEDAFAFTNYENKVAGVGGVIPDGEGNAYIWMLCTPDIKSLRVTFYRRAKLFIDELTKPYKMVYSECDMRNKVHHRLLKYLGFQLSEP